MKNNFLHTFLQFISILNVKVTRASAEQFLENHPEEGSMLAYVDALNRFKIENAAIKITENDFDDLPMPLITFLNRDGGTFALIRSFKNNTIEWLDTHNGWMRDRWDDFSKDWSGIVLVAEIDKNSGEQNFYIKRRAELIKNSRIPIAICLLGLLLFTLILSVPVRTAVLNALLILKLAGIAIGSLLLAKSVTTANGWVNKLCNAGPKINCQSVLDSPAARITSWFSWSDAGFIYFFGSFFGLLFSMDFSATLSSLLSIQLIFSTISMLFSGYSLYYQGFKAKMWCTLCLGAVSVLVMEALILFIYFSGNGFIVKWEAILGMALGFMVPIAFLLLFKNTAIKAQESRNLNKELSKLKSNPRIFESLMEGQRKMPEISQDMPLILIGNRSARHTITMVSNPLCTPCAMMHEKIENLIKENEEIKCQVIFISKTDDDNPGGQLVRKLFSLPERLQSGALRKWYGRNDKNFEVWNEAFGQYEELVNMQNVQELHNSWANMAKVKATPTLFINDKLLPEGLNVGDLPLQLSHINSDGREYGFANQPL